MSRNPNLAGAAWVAGPAGGTRCDAERAAFAVRLAAEFGAMLPVPPGRPGDERATARSGGSSCPSRTAVERRIHHQPKITNARGTLRRASL